ncbi:hypothetical protein FV246_24875 [Escherichia coli]|uniref:hypothetical protein n=1 Tax=Escherichia coli TaxID=562 RepID=UPI0011C9FCC4|nr:hypothetical protein [Escherichia coli]MBS9139672.1 hypothetical protein [Escherichia coli]TXO63051.1 hypothetical protein FV246_24875 [Escherichia coli]
MKYLIVFFGLMIVPGVHGKFIGRITPEQFSHGAAVCSVSNTEYSITVNCKNNRTPIGTDTGITMVMSYESDSPFNVHKAPYGGSHSSGVRKYDAGKYDDDWFGINLSYNSLNDWGGTMYFDFGNFGGEGRLHLIDQYYRPLTDPLYFKSTGSATYSLDTTVLNLGTGEVGQYVKGSVIIKQLKGGNQPVTLTVAGMGDDVEFSIDDRKWIRNGGSATLTGENNQQRLYFRWRGQQLGYNEKYVNVILTPY